MNAMNGIERVMDFGDAIGETKQNSATPPDYVDSSYGMGRKPDEDFP